MSEQYTISAVSDQTRPYDDKVAYYVKLNEANPAPEGLDHFELHQKRTSKAPAVGQTIDVKTFQEGEFGGKPYVKIIKDWDAIKNRSGSGGGSSQGSDERGESIERQVAAKVAGGMAMATPPGSVGAPAMLANFEAFFDSVLAKIKGGPQNGGEGRLNGGGEVPADTEGLPTASASAQDSLIQF